MLEKKRSVPASYPFPFFGAGNASYFEWAEVHVRFARVPTAEEQALIANRVPPPLRDSIDWEGEQLMVASGQFAHVVIARTYPADPDDRGIVDKDDDEEFERFFFAKDSQVKKFNHDIEQWLLFSHGRCPIFAAFRHEDGESGGTELSPWHDWSMKQLPHVLQALEPLLRAGHDSCAFYMLRGILAMAQEHKRGDIPEQYLDLLHPGRHERAAIQAGDGKQLVKLLSAGPIAEETLDAISDEFERLDSPGREKELRALLQAAPILLAQPSMPEALWPPLVSAAARTLAHHDEDYAGFELAYRVLQQAGNQLDSGHLGDELGNLAFWMAKHGLFAESLVLFEQLIRHPGLAKTTYCNALWAVMSDNNKLPVDAHLARLFLHGALPHGPENPAIFYNAACVCFELGDIDQVFANLQSAIAYGYEKPEQMEREPLFQPLRSDPRFAQIFASNHKKPNKPSAPRKTSKRTKSE